MEESGPSQHNPFWEHLLPYPSISSSSNQAYPSTDPFSSTTNAPAHPNNPCRFHNRLCLCRRDNLHQPQSLPGTTTSPSNLPSRECYNLNPPSLPEPRNPHPDASRQLPGIDSFASYLNPPEHPPSDISWASFGDDSLFDSDFWPHLENVENSQVNLDFGNSFGGNYFVDLTADAPPSPTMPPITRKRRASGASRETPSPPSRNSKRPRLERPGSGRKKEEVEHLDLVDVDDDGELSRVLEQQSAAAIKAQQGPQGDVPTKLSNTQCVICMEPMTDMTVTHCGKSTQCSRADQITERDFAVHRPHFLPYMHYGSTHCWRKSKRTGQSNFQMPRLSQEGGKAEREEQRQTGPDPS